MKTLQSWPTFVSYPQNAAALLLGVFLQVPFNAQIQVFTFCYEHIWLHVLTLNMPKLFYFIYFPFKSSSLSSVHARGLNFIVQKWNFCFNFKEWGREKQTEMVIKCYKVTWVIHEKKIMQRVNKNLCAQKAMK